MKPTSIIFLIVAAALILCGTVTCAVASAQAKAQDITLFENSDANGNYVAQYAVTGSSVNRIDLRLSEANIRIIGGAQSSYIEMFNFPTNSYRYSQTGGAVSIADSVDFTDLSSIFTLLSDGLKFDGMRQFFRFRSDNDREKIVNIYLSDTETVKRLDITLSSGHVSLKDLNVAADFNIKISAGNCTVTDSDGFSALNADIERGDFTYDGDLASGQLHVSLGTGSADVRVSRLNSRNVELVCTEGTVTYDGTERGPSYCPPKLDISTASLQITSYKGNIAVKLVGEFSPVNPAAPTTDADTAVDTAEPAA